MSWVKRIMGKATNELEASAVQAIGQLLDEASEGLEKTGDSTVKINKNHLKVEINSGLLASGRDVETQQERLKDSLQEAGLTIDRNIIHTDVTATGVSLGEIHIDIDRNGGLDVIKQKLNRHLRNEDLHTSHAEDVLTRRASEANQQTQR